jgi:hypothetical protein
MIYCNNQDELIKLHIMCINLLIYSIKLYLNDKININEVYIVQAGRYRCGNFHFAKCMQS